MRAVKKMDATQWMKDWDEAVAGLDSVSVRAERLRHQSDYIEQELDRLDSLEETKPQRRSFLRTLLGGAAA